MSALDAITIGDQYTNESIQGAWTICGITYEEIFPIAVLAKHPSVPDPIHVDLIDGQMPPRWRRVEERLPEPAVSLPEPDPRDHSLYTQVRSDADGETWQLEGVIRHGRRRVYRRVFEQRFWAWRTEWCEVAVGETPVDWRPL